MYIRITLRDIGVNPEKKQKVESRKLKVDSRVLIPFKLFYFSNLDSLRILDTYKM